MTVQHDRADDAIANPGHRVANVIDHMIVGRCSIAGAVTALIEGPQFITSGQRRQRQKRVPAAQHAVQHGQGRTARLRANVMQAAFLMTKLGVLPHERLNPGRQNNR